MSARRLLIVEDELLVALDIETIVSDAGLVVLGPVSRASEALTLIANGGPDAALLDANLGGEPITEVARSLSERGIPFAYVTGYGRESLPEGYEAPIVTKPFDAGQLLAAVRYLLDRATGTGSAA